MGLTEDALDFDGSIVRVVRQVKLIGGSAVAPHSKGIRTVLGTFGPGILGLLVVVGRLTGHEDPRGRR
ncbi:hypothetical protein AB0L59_17025 [Streptomyces sp. NPDC052109]|uniref:hypothetical protein n=1 Tax=Streptomyces sp. NPDC052109 TaxID=3155527 RepID=UPI003439F4CE